jgi:hypothetical protein
MPLINTPLGVAANILRRNALCSENPARNSRRLQFTFLLSTVRPTPTCISLRASYVWPARRDFLQEKKYGPQFSIFQSLD